MSIQNQPGAPKGVKPENLHYISEQHKAAWADRRAAMWLTGNAFSLFRGALSLIALPFVAVGALVLPKVTRQEVKSCVAEVAKGIFGIIPGSQKYFADRNAAFEKNTMEAAVSRMSYTDMVHDKNLLTSKEDAHAKNSLKPPLTKEEGAYLTALKTEINLLTTEVAETHWEIVQSWQQSTEKHSTDDPLLKRKLDCALALQEQYNVKFKADLKSFDKNAIYAIITTFDTDYALMTTFDTDVKNQKDIIEKSFKLPYTPTLLQVGCALQLMKQHCTDLLSQKYPEATNRMQALDEIMKIFDKNQNPIQAGDTVAIEFFMKRLDPKLQKLVKNLQTKLTSTEERSFADMALTTFLENRMITLSRQMMSENPRNILFLLKEIENISQKEPPSFTDQVFSNTFKDKKFYAEFIETLAKFVTSNSNEIDQKKLEHITQLIYLIKKEDIDNDNYQDFTDAVEKYLLKLSNEKLEFLLDTCNLAAIRTLISNTYTARIILLITLEEKNLDTLVPSYAALPDSRINVIKKNAVKQFFEDKLDNHLNENSSKIISSSMDLMNGLNEFIQSDPTIKSIILYLSKFLDQQQTISLVAYHFFIMLYQKKQLTLSILSDLYNKNFKNSDWKRGSAIYISLQKFIKYAYENQILTSEDNKYFINKANENLSPFEKLVSDSIGHANAEIRNVPSAKIGGRQRSQSEGDIVASDKKVNPLRRQSLGDTTTTAQPIDLQRRRSSIDSAAPNDSFIPTHTQFDLEEVIIADESEGEEPGGSV